MIKFFKTIAFLEGISFLALLANMLLMKPFNLELYKSLVFPIGISHGILFILYIALAVVLKIELKWSIPKLLFISLLAVLPFGSFYAERKI